MLGKVEVWTYLQGRYRDADVENGQKRGGKSGTNWGRGTDIYIPPCASQLRGTYRIVKRARLSAL